MHEYVWNNVVQDAQDLNMSLRHEIESLEAQHLKALRDYSSTNKQWRNTRR